jgi:hypothetical protein
MHLSLEARLLMFSIILIPKQSLEGNVDVQQSMHFDSQIVHFLSFHMLVAIEATTMCRHKGQDHSQSLCQCYSLN